jgi:mRNA interferase HicA
LLGQHRTTLKDRRKEIGKGLLAKMLADLCIDPNDF